MIRKHPLLVLLSVLCKSLQRSLIFIALPFSACALFGKAGAKVRRFFIPSKCFERKVCESWQFFALFYKIRVKRGRFWGKGRKKGDIQGTRPSCHGGGLGSKTGPYRGKTKPWRGETRAGELRKWGETDGNKSLLRLGNYFLLIIYSAGKAKVAVAGKSTPSCPLGGGQKPIAHPSGWSRDGFGTESRTRTSNFLMQARQQDHRPRIGSKVG